jgi:hypothetical protein
MSIDVQISDGKGSRKRARVYEDRGMATLQHPWPPPPVTNEAGRLRIFVQFLTIDGTSSGSKDMRVDGSSTNQKFYIPAHATNDCYISELNFVIADQNATLDKFGNLTALSNGCKLSYLDERGEVIINDGLTSNWEMIRMCGANPAFGDGANVFRAPNVAGTVEAYVPVLDFRKLFGFPWGLKLASGTRQEIAFTVRDNLSAGMDQLDCVAYGLERYPEE